MAIPLGRSSGCLQDVNPSPVWRDQPPRPAAANPAPAAWGSSCPRRRSGPRCAGKGLAKRLRPSTGTEATGQAWLGIALAYSHRSAPGNQLKAAGPDQGPGIRLRAHGGAGAGREQAGTARGPPAA